MRGCNDVVVSKSKLKTHYFGVGLFGNFQVILIMASYRFMGLLKAINNVLKHYAVCNDPPLQCYYICRLTLMKGAVWLVVKA